MGPFIAMLIIAVAVVADFFWFDIDRKRWGWMKNWSSRQKVLFFSGFAIVISLVYIGLSAEYL
ncbi:hypothetical protein [Aquibacillus rhizosphaerae]|uniref:Uncharacterized protein n=1 Tax=Aquibacillus rhizosphaerae TaxID=3051431 RepID=A0ABT7L0V0_9BACI|nr:hypothetical protein [Aquibacillus sp. LR5S19]MDL4839430.1 hypothetical protein [Aquibacillus sp. LR5S19]